jgi:uncharacterized protein
MVWAELIPEEPAEQARLPGGRRQLEALRGKYENADYTVHIIGFAKVVGDIADGAKSVVTFFGVAIALTFVLLSSTRARSGWPAGPCWRRWWR